MPNYYAHLEFGARVLMALPEPLRARLEGEQDAYILGQYGPDPLFFYRLIRGGGSVRAVGVRIHHQPVRSVMERLRRAVEEGAPFSAGYAAGFLCHFALDSRCHPYVKQWETDDRIAHMGIEGEFDRFLMVCNGVDPSRETAMPTPGMPDDFYTLLERYVYPGIKRRQYREGLRFYRKLTGWHTRAAGSRWNKGIWGLTAKVSPRGALLRDLVLKQEAGPRFAPCNQVLLALLQAEVPAAVKQLDAFFAGEPLGSWFDRDFYGGA